MTLSCPLPRSSAPAAAALLRAWGGAAPSGRLGWGGGLGLLGGALLHHLGEARPVDGDEQGLGLGAEPIAGVELAPGEDLATAHALEPALEAQLGVQRGRRAVVADAAPGHARCSRTRVRFTAIGNPSGRERGDAYVFERGVGE